MKRLILAAAALAVPLMSASAHAASIGVDDLFGGLRGHITFTYSNLDSGTSYFGSVAPPAGGTTGVIDLTQPANSGLNNLSAPGAVGNEDTWAVARVSSIQVNGVTVWAAGTFNNPGNSFTGRAAGEITAFVYGEHDTAIRLTDEGGGNTQLEAIGGGLQLALYYDDTPDYYNGLLQPGPGQRTGFTTFTNVTDGQLILTGRSTPGLASPVNGGPAPEFVSTTLINSSGQVASGHGGAYGNWTANDSGVGAFNNAFFQDTSPPFASDTPAHQFELRFDTSPQPALPTGWTASSNDPLITALPAGVPLPSSASAGAFLCALAAVAKFGRRRMA